MRIIVVHVIRVSKDPRSLGVHRVVDLLARRADVAS